MAGFGEPGRPLRRSAFLFGLTAGAGALVAFVALLGLRQLGTVLMMLVAATFLAVGLASGAASLAGALLIGVTTAILTLFVAASLDRLREAAYHLVVASQRERVRRLGDAAMQKIGGYLVGALGIAAVAGTAAFVYSMIAGLPYAFLLAVVVAVFDLIPQIGATLGATVVVLVALSESLTLALVTIAFFLCYQGVENWVVYPRVMSRAVRISNLAAIVAALVGGTPFGVLGVLVAVPAYASIQLVVREVVFPRQEAR